MSFDGDGLVTTNFTSEFDGAEGGVALQSDGKIVAAGSADVSRHFHSPSFALARYLTDGSPDMSFSGDGKLRTTFTGRSNLGIQGAQDVAIDPNEKIVAAGDVAENRKFAVVRYLGG
jgi:uncharacterized delta-60 repeat protein